MCGRFSFAAKPEDIESLLPGLRVDRLTILDNNLAPLQLVPVVLNDGKREVSSARWGIVPSWARDRSIGGKLFNARSETAAIKPSFRESFKKYRCLILADGFYEWKAEPGEKRKTQFVFRLKTGKPFAFAGLWNNWKDNDGSFHLTCTILTTASNTLIKDIHDRMPVILLSKFYETWLKKDYVSQDELLKCLIPYPYNDLEVHRI
ncbi:MAG: SOS response-associated peptidase [Spirochaetes bacterium]|nr:SOS response-associated peptidase [Spirochaetota bacterium]MCK5268575.1 SOS response-associated peptidase [Spirochaetota bacterium]